MTLLGGCLSEDDYHQFLPDNQTSVSQLERTLASSVLFSLQADIGMGALSP